MSPEPLRPLRIALLAKAPVPGLAKTRLAPALGAEGAAALAAQLLRHAAAQAAAAAPGAVTLWAAPDAAHPLFTELQRTHALALQTQPAGDLGARMAGAFRQAWAEGAGPVLLMGADIPALDAALLRRAATTLRHATAVFVPARDGGYALVGLRAPQPGLLAALFDGLPWSTPQVMAHTLARLAAAGVAVALLPPVHDIDEPADLPHLPAGWDDLLHLPPDGCAERGGPGSDDNRGLRSAVEGDTVHDPDPSSRPPAPPPHTMSAPDESSLPAAAVEPAAPTEPATEAPPVMPAPMTDAAPAPSAPIAEMAPEPSASSSDAVTEPGAPTTDAAPEPGAPLPAADTAAQPAAPEAGAEAEAADEPGPEAAAASPAELADPAGTVPARPAVPELSPAACAAALAERFPALFGAPRALPLKLRIQADIQARAPGVFTKKSLSVFLHRHTTSTAYLRALVNTPTRHDLDGQPAGEVAEEHRLAATAEVERRRAIVEARRQAEREAAREAYRQARQAGRAAGHGATAPADAPAGAPAGAEAPVTASEGGAPATAPRPDRPPRGDRPPRRDARGPGEGPARGERPPRPDRPDRPGRPEGAGRGDRPHRADRPARPPQAQSDAQGSGHEGRRGADPSAAARSPSAPDDRAAPAAHAPAYSAAEQEARRERAALLRAYEGSTLTRANFCVLKRIGEAELETQLALARQERAQDPRPAPRREDEPSRDGGRGDRGPRDARQSRPASGRPPFKPQR